jgi:hypothetical protein
MSFFSRKTVSISIAIFSILLISSLWVIFKLIKFHENNDPVVVYTDSPALIANVKRFQCTPSPTVVLDINDYSYNVLEKPLATPIYRYTSILDAEPPVHIHILTMQAGSGRVIVEKSDKPIGYVTVKCGILV